jgi:hypothetical protein
MSLGRVVSIAVSVRERNEFFVAIVEKISSLQQNVVTR